MIKNKNTHRTVQSSTAISDGFKQVKCCISETGVFIFTKSQKRYFDLYLKKNLGLKSLVQKPWFREEPCFNQGSSFFPWTFIIKLYIKKLLQDFNCTDQCSNYQLNLKLSHRCLDLHLETNQNQFTKCLQKMLVM